jgi:hypothetical protein
MNTATIWVFVFIAALGSLMYFLATRKSKITASNYVAPVEPESTPTPIPSNGKKPPFPES